VPPFVIQYFPMTTAPTARLLGIDWGTSNRRAWWLAVDGSVLAEHSDDQGLLAVQGRFAESLVALRGHGPALADTAPLLMAGMVGSASGWREVPYLDAATPLDRIAHHLAAVPQAGPRAFIVPGLCFAAADGSVDVMRGEETQLLGAHVLGHGDGWFVLPGTHSKWVRLQGGRVAELATAMTGELFALLTQHGTLAGITREGDADPPSFARGVAAAGRSSLSNALFGCRAQVMAGRMPARHARDYLSGLLIGAEWHDVARRVGRMPERVTLIGSRALAPPYAAAAALFGCTLTALDARAVQLAAFHALQNAL
jgi:2-dehydro-3-deoxygalactonokinase